MFGFFKDKLNDIKKAVSNTAQSLVGNVVAAVDTEEEVYSEFALEDIEDTLIGADLGVNYAAELVDNLRAKKDAKPSELKNYLKTEFKKTLEEAGSTELNYKENELNICDLLIKIGFANSKSEAKRMILGNGIKINGVTVTDVNKVIEFSKELVVQFGKNKFKKIIK